MADLSNAWSSSLNGDLSPGFYTIGIAALSVAPDPTFTIDFATPICRLLPSRNHRPGR